MNTSLLLVCIGIIIVFMMDMQRISRRETKKTWSTVYNRSQNKEQYSLKKINRLELIGWGLLLLIVWGNLVQRISSELGGPNLIQTMILCGCLILDILALNTRVGLKLFCGTEKK